MAVNSKKINVRSLTLGMYVAKLDRPWIQTSYPIEGFYIQNNEDIKKLSSLCKFVFIDIDLSKLRVDISHLNNIPSVSSAKLSLQSTQGSDDTFTTIVHGQQQEKKQLKRDKTLYIKRAPFEKEFKTANKLYETITETAEQVFNQAASGQIFDIKQVNQAASTMVDSIIRNPDAFLWLSRLKAKDSHSHNRSIRATIWAIAFGRHLSLQKKELTELSIAVLLANIGKARIPRQLLEKSENLEGAELSVYQKHINISVTILKKMSLFSKQTIEIIAAHCERYDGSGYPKKLSHDNIIFPAQIAGLVCFYEKITNQRDSRYSLDATRAMEHLYKLRGTQFQAELVEEFIQSIGIYPAGSLIELNSREIAVIVEQNEHHRLLPKVMILRDSQKKPVNSMKILDLSKLSTDQGIGPKIIDSIPLGSYDINADEIIESIQQADKNWLMKKLFS